jgi:energy-coupling factor transport system permease protein
MPGNTVVHRLDPRTKIILTTAYIAMIFLVSSPVWYVVPTLYVALSARLAGLSFGQLLKSVKPLRFLLILTFVLNLFFSGGTTVLVRWGVVTITQEACCWPCISACGWCSWWWARRCDADHIAVALSDGIEILLKPLKVFHFPAHELAMMLTIALRFIPTLIEKPTRS